MWAFIASTLFSFLQQLTHSWLIMACTLERFGLKEIFLKKKTRIFHLKTHKTKQLIKSSFRESEKTISKRFTKVF